MPKYLDYHGLETLTGDIDAAYVKKSQKGVANGVASLNSNGKIPTSQIPDINTVPAGGTAGQVLAKNSSTDYDLTWVNQSGGGGGSGTSDYSNLINKPQIAGVTLSGNKSLSDLGIAAEVSVSQLANYKLNAPSTVGTAGQVLGLSGNLEPIWIDVSGGSTVTETIVPEQTVNATQGTRITFFKGLVAGEQYVFTVDGDSVTGTTESRSNSIIYAYTNSIVFEYINDVMYFGVYDQTLYGEHTIKVTKTIRSGGNAFNPWANKKVCVFGDSLGQGYNNNDYSFVDILEEYGMFSSIHKNCTAGARTTALPDKLVESATQVAEADIVYCEFEYNDVLALATASISISDITSAIRSSYAYIRQVNPTCAIVWMPITMCHPNRSVISSYEPYVYNWCNAAYPIFAELGIGMLPTYDLISMEGHVSSDESHPNTAGHRLIADLVMQNPLGYSSYPMQLTRANKIVVVPEQNIETTERSNRITNYAEAPIVGERYDYYINGQMYSTTAIDLYNSIYIGDPRLASIGVFEYSQNYLYFTLVDESLIGNTYTVKIEK